MDLSPLSMHYMQSTNSVVHDILHMSLDYAMVPGGVRPTTPAITSYPIESYFITSGTRRRLEQFVRTM